jgi:hypothetical protein
VWLRLLLLFLLPLLLLLLGSGGCAGCCFGKRLTAERGTGVPLPALRHPRGHSLG